MTDAKDSDARIAIIGMAGRFPGASGIDEFWAACRDGVNCISLWDGTRVGGRVLAGGLFADQECFDAEAFGISPAQAEILDPQHRIFLELCWQALEHASVAADKDTLVSVYASAAPSRYRPECAESDSENIRYQRMISNGADYLATRVSYHLDLRGEAVNIQTACSSSLVAVHLACVSLQTKRSDVAIAGGVSIDPDQEQGYAYEDGMISSPDGRCRPFDAGALGAVPGNGGAVVVLQRLADAIKQRRTVHAVIRATAINNDGRAKSSFMAPNVEGQSQAIATAIAIAGVPADSIGYLEGHGTATQLGDSIEFEAARTAFRYFTDRSAFCALGSLKANFGHMDRAAGVAGLIKAAIAVREGVIPPLLGFCQPNPDFDLADSPFRFPTTAELWLSNSPRRAGVSSFGVGGTNAHVIVEEFQQQCLTVPPATDVDGPIAFPLSAHCEEALVELGRELAVAFGRAQAALDVAHTLAKGRVARPTRAVVVASPRNASDALAHLPHAINALRPPGPVVFLFPGQGAEIGYAAHRLAARYEVFRYEIEEFAKELGVLPSQLLDGVSGNDVKFREFAYQPALVAVQVALARLAEHVGIVGSAFCGNSIGEYAAAHMAGVFSRRDLMSVLAARDRHMRAAPEGLMLMVSMGEEEIGPLQLAGIDLAGVNSSDRVLLSGPPEEVHRQHALLEQRGILARVLPGRVAPHGRLMRGVAGAFRRAFEGIVLARPTRPLVSTLTGGWADSDQLATPEHWVRHLCEPFRFRYALEVLSKAGYDRFVEASPGGALTKLVRNLDGSTTCSTLGGDSDVDPETSFLAAVGELWCSGCELDWDQANASSEARFTPLPTYPFKRRPYWTHHAWNSASRLSVGERSGWLERPVWVPLPHGARWVARDIPRHVVVRGGGQVAAELIDRLSKIGTYASRAEEADPESGAEDCVLVDLTQIGPLPENGRPIDEISLSAWLEFGFLGPLDVVRRLRPATLFLVTRGLWPVTPGDRPAAPSSGIVGIARCAPHDWPGMRTRLVDLSANEDGVGDVDAILAELASSEERDIAYRGTIRYRRSYELTTPAGPSRLRRGGTYLVLGGTGRLGAVVAEAISREVDATVVLVGRNVGRTTTSDVDRLIAVATARGCKVSTLRARSDDQVQLRGLLDELTATHGRIDGIFHLAANTDITSFDPLSEVTALAALGVTQAKVCTAALLASELDGREYDFVALFSSISTVIGANRFGAYVAANAFLDALASSMTSGSGRTWYSLVWDGWAADGVASPNALGFGDGAALLLQALRSDHAVVAPVVRPLNQRLAAVRADLVVVAQASKEAAPSAPDTSILERVLHVVKHVTGYAKVDPKRNFASLGIDSLRLMQIVVRLRPVESKYIGIGRLLSATSSEELAALVDAAGPLNPEGADFSVGNQDLSTPQQRLWYLAQLDPHSSNYNVPFGWQLPPLGRARVLETVLSTLNRHEMLRSAYRQDTDGRPCRDLVEAHKIPVTMIELDPTDPVASFYRIAREFVELPFDLQNGTTRVLVAFCPESTRLVFVCHHISIDAWSVKLLGEEIHRSLSSATGPDKTQHARYRDFVRWEHEMRNGPEYERLAQHWRETLYDLQPTVPPFEETAAQVGDRPCGTAETVLPREHFIALRTILRSERATLYAAALTGLAIALGAWCKVREVVIGTNLANRMREDFESVVGLFVDPVVLRLAPGLDDPTTTLGEALARVRDCLATAMAHTGIPYLDVVRLSGRRSSEGDNPLFSVIATMFDTEGGEAFAIPLNVPLPATAKFELAVEFLPRPDGLLVHVLYAADRYRPSTIDQLLQRIVSYLELLSNGGANSLLSGMLDEKPVISAREKFAQRFDRLMASEDPLDFSRRSLGK